MYKFDSDEPQAKLKDLCSADKKKIGYLIKRLAEEREQKEQLLQQLGRQSQQTQRQITLHNEIDQLDLEISELKRVNNEHQSPNFKSLIIKRVDVQDSDSFTIPITQRESPTKVDQMMQTSNVIEIRNQDNKSTKKKRSSQKKQLLMQKIAEFEKIVNRLNFSKASEEEHSTSNCDSSSQNMSMIQGVYQKILNLENQLQQQENLVQEQQKQLNEPEQYQQTQTQTQLFQQPQQVQDEDLLMLQLLNSDQCQYRPPLRQVQQNVQQQSKLENSQTIKKSLNCRSVILKYDNLVKELNQQ